MHHHVLTVATSERVPRAKSKSRLRSAAPVQVETPTNARSGGDATVEFDAADGAASATASHSASASASAAVAAATAATAASPSGTPVSQRRPGRNGLVMAASPWRPRTWAERTTRGAALEEQQKGRAKGGHATAHNIASPNLARHVFRTLLSEQQRRERLASPSASPTAAGRRRSAAATAAALVNSGTGGNFMSPRSLRAEIEAERNAVYLNLLLAHARNIPAVRNGKPVRSGTLIRSRSTPALALPNRWAGGSGVFRRTDLPHASSAVAAAPAAPVRVAPRQVPRRTMRRAQSQPRLSTIGATSGATRGPGGGGGGSGSGWDFLTGLANSDDHGFTQSLATSQNRARLGVRDPRHARSGSRAAGSAGRDRVAPAPVPEGTEPTDADAHAETEVLPQRGRRQLLSPERKAYASALRRRAELDALHDAAPHLRATEPVRIARKPRVPAVSAAAVAERRRRRSADGAAHAESAAAAQHRTDALTPAQPWMSPTADRARRSMSRVSAPQAKQQRLAQSQSERTLSRVRSLHQHASQQQLQTPERPPRPMRSSQSAAVLPPLSDAPGVNGAVATDAPGAAALHDSDRARRQPRPNPEGSAFARTPLAPLLPSLLGKHKHMTVSNRSIAAAAEVALSAPQTAATVSDSAAAATASADANATASAESAAAAPLPPAVAVATDGFEVRLNAAAARPGSAKDAFLQHAGQYLSAGTPMAAQAGAATAAAASASTSTAAATPKRAAPAHSPAEAPEPWPAAPAASASAASSAPPPLVAALDTDAHATRQDMKMEEPPSLAAPAAADAQRNAAGTHGTVGKGKSKGKGKGKAMSTEELAARLIHKTMKPSKSLDAVAGGEETKQPDRTKKRSASRGSRGSSRPVTVSARLTTPSAVRAASRQRPLIPPDDDAFGFTAAHAAARAVVLSGSNPSTAPAPAHAQAPALPQLQSQPQPQPQQALSTSVQTIGLGPADSLHAVNTAPLLASLFRGQKPSSPPRSPKTAARRASPPRGSGGGGAGNGVGAVAGTEAGVVLPPLRSASPPRAHSPPRAAHTAAEGARVRGADFAQQRARTGAYARVIAGNAARNRTTLLHGVGFGRAQVWAGEPEFIDLADDAPALQTQTAVALAYRDVVAAERHAKAKAKAQANAGGDDDAPGVAVADAPASRSGSPSPHSSRPQSRNGPPLPRSPEQHLLVGGGLIASAVQQSLTPRGPRPSVAPAAASTALPPATGATDSDETASPPSDPAASAAAGAGDPNAPPARMSRYHPLRQPKPSPLLARLLYEQLHGIDSAAPGADATVSSPSPAVSVAKKKKRRKSPVKPVPKPAAAEDDDEDDAARAQREAEEEAAAEAAAVAAANAEPALTRPALQSRPSITASAALAALAAKPEPPGSTAAAAARASTPSTPAVSFAQAQAAVVSAAVSAAVASVSKPNTAASLDETKRADPPTDAPAPESADADADGAEPESPEVREFARSLSSFGQSAVAPPDAAAGDGPGIPAPVKLTGARRREKPRAAGGGIKPGVVVHGVASANAIVRPAYEPLFLPSEWMADFKKREHVRATRPAAAAKLL